MAFQDKLLKRVIFRLLGYLGIRLTKMRDEGSLRIFLDTLHPIKFKLLRIGGDSDGGYLVPDDLENISSCFSPGVSDIFDFELDLSGRGIPSYMADYSVSPETVMNPNFHFIQKFVGPVESIQEMNFENWVISNSEESQDLILQMDIEGAEYAALLSCNQSVLKRFRILVIEFHGLELLLDYQASPILENCFKKLLQDFYVVHIHPNNNDPSRFYKTTEIPSLMEFTFIRKDRVHQFEYETSYPHSLDRPTVSNRPDIKLPATWYRSY